MHASGGDLVLDLLIGPGDALCLLPAPQPPVFGENQERGEGRRSNKNLPGNSGPWLARYRLGKWRRDTRDRMGVHEFCSLKTILDIRRSSSPTRGAGRRPPSPSPWVGGETRSSDGLVRQGRWTLFR